MYHYQYQKIGHDNSKPFQVLVGAQLWQDNKSYWVKRELTIPKTLNRSEIDKILEQFKSDFFQEFPESKDSVLKILQDENFGNLHTSELKYFDQLSSLCPYLLDNEYPLELLEILAYVNMLDIDICYVELEEYHGRFTSLAECGKYYCDQSSIQFPDWLRVKYDETAEVLVNSGLIGIYKTDSFYYLFIPRKGYFIPPSF